MEMDKLLEELREDLKVLGKEVKSGQKELADQLTKSLINQVATNERVTTFLEREWPDFVYKVKQVEDTGRKAELELLRIEAKMREQETAHFGLKSNQEVFNSDQKAIKAFLDKMNTDIIALNTPKQEDLKAGLFVESILRILWIILGAAIVGGVQLIIKLISI
jgi:hypothetical protein